MNTLHIGLLHLPALDEMILIECHIRDHRHKRQAICTSSPPAQAASYISIYKSAMFMGRRCYSKGTVSLDRPSISLISTSNIGYA